MLCVFQTRWYLCELPVLIRHQRRQPNLTLAHLKQNLTVFAFLRYCLVVAQAIWEAQHGIAALKRDFETLFSALMSMEDFERLEIYEGYVEKKVMPSGEHSDAQGSIYGELRKHFQKKPPGDGTGGWWLKTETSVFYPRFERMFNHDIAGRTLLDCRR